MVTRELLRKLLNGEAVSKDYNALEMDKKDRLKVKNAKGSGGEGLIEKVLKNFPGVCISCEKLKEIYETYHKKEGESFSIISFSFEFYCYTSDKYNFYMPDFYNAYNGNEYVIVDNPYITCIYENEDGDDATLDFTDEEIQQCIVSRDEFIKDLVKRMTDY